MRLFEIVENCSVRVTAARHGLRRPTHNMLATEHGFLMEELEAARAEFRTAIAALRAHRQG
jgi:hypothetical protein